MTSLEPEKHKDSPPSNQTGSRGQLTYLFGRRGFGYRAFGLINVGFLGFFSKRLWASSSRLSSQQPHGDSVPPRIKKDPKEYQAVVIGSGFGGAVVALRLSKLYGDQVLVVERGKRYPRGSFARDLPGFLNSFWNQKDEPVPRPFPLASQSNGVFDLRSYGGMDTLVAAGFGGGSLIYAAALLEPTDPDFDQSWPESMKREKLDHYFDVVKSVLAARPVPINDTDRKIDRHQLFKHAAKELQGEIEDVNVAINFGGADTESVPAPMGEETINAHGAPQTSCSYCAECILGCNYHAKNTLDLNYLFAAEHKYGAAVKTLTQADKIIPLNEAGDEDEGADGSHGFNVYLKGTGDTGADFDYEIIKANRVIVAAGAYGSNELLLRNQLVHKSLPRISSRLGQGFSGNGDFINLVLTDQAQNISNFGPTITTRTRFRREPAQKEEFIVEDMGFPGASKWLKWIFELCRPRTWFARWTAMPLYTYLQQAATRSDLVLSRLVVLLGIGVDNNEGQMTLNQKGLLQLRWNSNTSKKLYDRFIENGRAYKNAWRARFVTPLPTYTLRRNFTVHPLGGCSLGENSNDGVVDSRREHFGSVFGYRNLYVADGSIVPSAVGVNPALTIAALAEMVAEGITGEHPTKIL